MEIGQKIIPITSKILHIWKQLGEFKGGRIEEKISGVFYVVEGYGIILTDKR